LVTRLAAGHHSRVTLTSPVAKPAERGVPSLVWRAGQDRRWAMICQAAGERLMGGHVLDVGCGVGMYLRAFREITPHRFGVEIEGERARQAAAHGCVVQAPGGRLPFACDTFDLVLSHEVIEHVADDRACVAEMVRVLRSGGRLVVFCPNRLYPFETHGHYWRGRYYFGNTPLINYLPDRLRDRLAPHVRTYTGRTVRALFDGLPVRIISHSRVFPGYDNLVAHRPILGRWMRWITYHLERSPLQALGLSHLLVVEKHAGPE
jgi:SAM-dependent methyltransferase